MRHRLLMAALSLGLAACATLPGGKPAPGDPFERVNRSIWTFDYALDKKILRPVARGYTRLPHPIRTGIHNFVTNFEYSDTLVNDFLEGRFGYAGNDLARLLVNTVLGVGGLFDPASGMQLDRHNADFGQTLGVWGLETGPFLMLPFLGPSDVRDGLGRIADTYTEPYAWISSLYVSGGIDVLSKVDERAGLLNQNQLIDSAFDPYAFVRNAYLQNRRFRVHGGSAQPETPEQLFPGLESGGDDADGSPGNNGGGAAPAGGAGKPPPVPPR